MDGRRGQPRQEAESDRRPLPIRSQALGSTRESCFLLVTFLCSQQRKVTRARQRTKRFRTRQKDPEPQNPDATVSKRK